MLLPCGLGQLHAKGWPGSHGKNIVWNYKLGGYQVLKKWLSYREHKILTRPLNLDEVQHFTNTARRIAAILELTAVTD